MVANHTYSHFIDTIEQWDRTFAINTWSVPLLPIRREVDDQTRSRREDHRVLLFRWETRCGFGSLLSSETLTDADGALGLRMMSLYGATKSAIRGLTQGAGESRSIIKAYNGSCRSPRSGKFCNHR